MKAVVYLLGIVLIAIAIVYFVFPADQLPSYMPGHLDGAAHVRLKHGIAAAVIGVVMLAIGRFMPQRA